MSTLSDPDTQLDQLLPPARARRSAQVAPVAARAGRSCSRNMATTFAAHQRATRRRCRQTIEKSPPTHRHRRSRSFRVQRPFLADFADLSRRLRPAVNELPRSLPAINRAFRVGTPVLPRTVELNDRLRKTLRRARRPVREPQHAARHPRPAHHADAVTRRRSSSSRPTRRSATTANYFLYPLGEHQSEVSRAGRHRPAAGRSSLPNNAAAQHLRRRSAASRPVDTPPGRGPVGAEALGPEQLGRFYSHALPAGHRRPGQRRLPDRPERLRQGPLVPEAATGPARRPTATPSGGNAAVASPTSRSCPAAPTSRASSASTTSGTWTSCADGPQAASIRSTSAACRRFKAGLIAIVVVIVAGRSSASPSQPVREPLRAQGARSRTPTTSSRTRRCGSPAWRWARSRRSRRSRGGTGARDRDDGDQGEGLPIHEDADAEDPPAHLPRGQLLRGHQARLAVGARAGRAASRSRRPRPRRRCSSATC